MSRPNVLVICSDEHARSTLGCYGHPIVRTPNLDRLANSGTRFDRAYTPSPTCVSARACLATGLHVHENRCWSSAQPYHGQCDSWMHKLRRAGHSVVSFGKLHFRSSSDDNGFSEEILPMHVPNEGKGWPQALLRKPMTDYPEVAELARDLGPGESDYTEYDRRVASEACRWLRQHPRKIRDRSWVLFVSFVSPHFPLKAPRAFFDIYANLKLPESLHRLLTERPTHPVLREMRKFWCYDDHFSEETRDIALRSYFGLCSFLDDNVGQVLQALEDSGSAETTTVVYTSDHGEMLGNHGFWGKCLMYEDSVGIPLILTGPGVPQGISLTPASLVDISATILQGVGIPEAAKVEDWKGRSLLDLARSPRPDRMVLSEYHDGGSPSGLFMVRQGRWKYVHYAGGYPAQLFDMTSDANELSDRGQVRSHAAQRAQMLARLQDVLDPEQVNAEAFRDQEEQLALFGGADAVLSAPGYGGHTPAP